VPGREIENQEAFHLGPLLDELPQQPGTHLRLFQLEIGFLGKAYRPGRQGDLSIDGRHRGNPLVRGGPSLQERADVPGGLLPPYPTVMRTARSPDACRPGTTWARCRTNSALSFGEIIRKPVLPFLRR